MTKFFIKSKKNYFGAILGPFCPNFGKNEFSWNKGFLKKRFLKDFQFLEIPIIYHRAKNQKNLLSYF